MPPDEFPSGGIDAHLNGRRFAIAVSRPDQRAHLVLCGCGGDVLQRAFYAVLLKLAVIAAQGHLGEKHKLGARAPSPRDMSQNDR